MGRAGGTGLLIAGIILAFLGLVLRWDLIDWLIDATGLILILIGVVLAVVGIIQMMGNRNKGSSMDF